MLLHRRIILALFLLGFMNCSVIRKIHGTDSNKKMIFNATIITMNKESDIIENAYLIIDNNIITEIGEGPPPQFNGYTIDAKNQILLPGLINSHTHIPMTIFRGIADDLPLDIWLNKYIWPAEKMFLSEETVSIGTQLGLLEMIQSGTTTYIDNYFFSETIAKETEKSGIRGVIGETILDFPTNSYKNTDEALDIAEKLILKWRNHPHIHPAVTPHSVYVCSKETLEKSSALASKYNVAVTTHVSETSKEVDDFVKENGIRPPEYLYNLGLFNNTVKAAHCVWLNDNDIEIFRKNNISISHNPSSNLKLASGIAPVQKYIDSGINVCIGTDGAASNNNLDLLEEVRLAALLHKGVTNNPEAIDAETALRMITINGAKALGMENIIGSVEIGKRADIILINKMHASNVPIYDYYSTIIYSTNSSSVETVIVDGKILMLNKKLFTLNEEDIFEKTINLKSRIEKYIEEQNYSWYKGNLHMHSYWSDGDDFPENTIEWYKNNDYNFVSLSDHNILSEGEKIYNNSIKLKTYQELKSIFEEENKFLILQSEEISDSYNKKPIHLNVINIQKLIVPQKGNSVIKVLQNNIDAVLEQRKETGLPIISIINHPNFGYAFSDNEMKKLKNARFFEVYNCHPRVNNSGDSTHIDTENMWDMINIEYSKNNKDLIFGLASDDTHNYKRFGKEYANPGRGWIMVKAKSLKPPDLIESMEKGLFYSSSGVILQDINYQNNTLKISIEPQAGIKYTTQFIGAYKNEETPRILKTSKGINAEYKLDNNILFVRAKIISTKLKENSISDNEFEAAWTQPVIFLKSFN
ncbi:amidohydrolase family protein [Bacteroidota bacterium]